ncbi:MAG: hypothetical protein WKF89_00115 [Chitinophagaceae bacterium]
MFTSKHHLHENLGLDFEIAAFFVDRNVPVENLYWKEKYLYVSSGTGYLFIPLFVDIQYKCGVSIENLLEEEYIRLMEAILHSAAMHEHKLIQFQTHVSNCKALCKNKVKNVPLYTDLLEYFENDLRMYKNLGTNNKALNRADTFLFTLCYLDLPGKITNTIIEKWYALVPSLLLMDDIMDLKDDQEKNEENAVNGFSTGSEGVETAITFLREKFLAVKSFNIKLGEFLEGSLMRKLQTPYMTSMLKS